MGASESRNGSENDSSDDGEDWMQADKYAEWECAYRMDYNGTALSLRHVEMPLDESGKKRLTSATNNDKAEPGEGRSLGMFAHEALVFEVMCMDGRVTKFTVELTFGGVLKRWGHHKVLSGVKGQKSINLPMDEVLKRIETKRSYDLLRYNCKHFAEEKFKLF